VNNRSSAGQLNVGIEMATVKELIISMIRFDELRYLTGRQKIDYIGKLIRRIPSSKDEFYRKLALGVFSNSNFSDTTIALTAASCELGEDPLTSELFRAP
jgi:hypothetical protein